VDSIEWWRTQHPAGMWGNPAGRRNGLRNGGGPRWWNFWLAAAVRGGWSHPHAARKHAARKSSSLRRTPPPSKETLLIKTSRFMVYGFTGRPLADRDPYVISLAMREVKLRPGTRSSWKRMLDYLEK